MTEEKLIDHIISRLEPQILDYVEVRHPQTTSNLQIIDKYEERFLNRKIRGSSWEFRDTNPSENNRFPNMNRQENWRETRGNNRYSDNSRPRREFNRFKGQGVADNRRFDGRRRGGQSDNRFHNQGGRQGGSRHSAFKDQPGLTHVLYNEIDTGDKGPVVSRPYRYDRVKQGIIDYPIEKMLQEDSPEAYRFMIDYRKLNAITKYPRYPLPVIDDLITNIPHTGIISTLDLKSSYFQLAISPKDIEKTAFITRNATFAFLRMPFGLSGAAPNFQKTIDIKLKPVIGRFVMVYVDDVIVTSPSFNEHIDHLNQVFTLRDAGLTLNKEKCHFARDKLKYFGLIISKEGIETDNSKVKTIAEMKPPKNNREVSKFLGMAGWYQKFIPNYADICEPLYRLKKKGAKFNWSTEAQDAFKKVKRALTEAPVLQLPNFKEQFNLFTDASGVGFGAVLNQNHRPIAFAFRTLNKTERNYTVTERECLAVI
ncbi:retrovirus-related Pol polyprotein from transposon 297 [Trichonephila clavipes]|nr:retrovirus-related Pol polyprotein from transposon 297 [Trichonephila clavipes]